MKNLLKLYCKIFFLKIINDDDETNVLKLFLIVSGELSVCDLIVYGLSDELSVYCLSDELSVYGLIVYETNVYEKIDDGWIVYGLIVYEKNVYEKIDGWLCVYDYLPFLLFSLLRTLFEIY